MKQFAVKLLVFFLPIILMVYVMDIFISKNVRKSNKGENPVWSDLYGGAINSDIVVYGASRAWQHFDTKIIADSLNHSTYNLGIQAYDFRMQLLRHRLLLKYNKKPRLIIQSLDFLTFQSRSDLFDPGQFLPYMLFDTLMQKYTIGYKGYTWYDYNIPLIRYYGQLNKIHQAFSFYFTKQLDPVDRVRGYASYDTPFVNAFTEGKGYAKYYEIKFDPKIINVFDGFLRECQQKNIKMVFVYTPEYIDGQRYVRNRNQLFLLIHHFCEKYSIKLYDYSADKMSFDTTYFYNSEHLNKTGAQLFSKKFAGDLRRDSTEIFR